MTEAELAELEAAANRCARVEANACEGDACWNTRVYEWDQTTPKGASWDSDKRLLANAAPALLSLTRRASKLEGALRIAEQYVRSRHNEGNPSCCTCDSKSPRGVCKDLVQIREALAPEDR